MTSRIPWDWDAGSVVCSGVSPAYQKQINDALNRMNSGMFNNLLKSYSDAPKFQHWSTAKCYDCGKFFRVNGGMLIGGGPSEMCPHCGAKGNI